MSILDELETIISDEEVQKEGFKDVFKTGIKLLPVFATMFQLLTTDLKASSVSNEKNNVAVALVDMQEAKSKDVLDAAAQKVQELISKVKDIKRKEQMIDNFKKAYAEMEKKIN